MSWLSQELNKECCLTCQHFKVGRRMKSVERNLYATTGTCKLFNNFPRIINCKPTTGSWGHYKCWIELPEKD